MFVAHVLHRCGLGKRERGLSTKGIDPAVGRDLLPLQLLLLLHQRQRVRVRTCIL